MSAQTKHTLLYVAGVGGFGQVFQVKLKSDGEEDRYYALKVMRKSDIPNTRSDREHVKSEHHALTSLTHPFIVKLMCCYQSPSKLFYVTEFLQGGELYTWMERAQRFDRVSAESSVAKRKKLGNVILPERPGPPASQSGIQYAWTKSQT